jgi:septal ring factor EnvC (AmiA/AmiB activator)
MFLITQIGFSLLLAALLGALLSLALRGRRQATRRLDFEESLQAAEFRHTEQLALFGADHEAALAALAQARHEIAATLEQTRSEASSVQSQLAQREQQLRDLSGVLLKANQDLAKGESVRRTLLLERQRAREESEVLRKQVVTTRAELAQMLGLHEQERTRLMAEVSALRRGELALDASVVEGQDALAHGVAPEQHAAVLQERDLLMARMQEMVQLMQRAQQQLEQRTDHLESLQASSAAAAADGTPAAPRRAA